MAANVPRPIRTFRRSTHQVKRPSLLGRLDSLISILVTVPKERTESEVLQVATYMKAIPFFTELVSSLDKDALMQCCQVMTAEYFAEEQFVFNAGDPGHTFYVIISGSVAVLNPEGKQDGDLTYTELARLKAGDSFGELALISSELRAGTAVCRENTVLGVLNKADYLRILGKAQSAKLAKKVDLLQSNPVFSRWTKYSLQKFSYFFHEKAYKRKQILHQAGTEVSEIFLVQSGDFQLTMRIQVPVRRALGQGKDQTACQAEVTLVSSGELLGAVEAIQGQLHRYTCTCYSTTGSLLAISKRDFLSRMVGDEAAQKVIKVSELVEVQRRTRLEKISKRERERYDLRSLFFSNSISALSSPVLWAKQDLEAEVRERWRGADLEVTVPSPPSLSPVISYCSPSPRPLPQHNRSWSDLIQAKFAQSKPLPKRPPPVINIHTHRLRPLPSAYLRFLQTTLPTPGLP